MFRNTFFILLLFVLFVVGLIHVTGNLFFLYWKFWWLDMVSHFGGGFWVGGTTLWVYDHLYSFKNNSDNWFQIILLSLFASLAIGFMWEIFEVLIGSTVLPNENYFSDTVIDLIFDSIGALVAGVIFLSTARCKYYNTVVEK